jgi:hypothetical protein
MKRIWCDSHCSLNVLNVIRARLCKYATPAKGTIKNFLYLLNYIEDPNVGYASWEVGPRAEHGVKMRWAPGWKLGYIVLCFGYLASMNAMDHLHSISIPVEDSPLFDAIQEKDFEKVQDLLEQGEDVNAKRATSEETPLMDAAASGLTNICKLLLERGADVRLVEFNGQTVFSQVLCSADLWQECSDEEAEQMLPLPEILKREEWQYALFGTLIIESMLVPYCSQNQMNDAQHRILAVLCTLRSICPQMPRDIRYKIISSDEEIMKDALLCSFGLHRGHYERVLSMPYSITKLLIQSHILDGEAAMQRLRIHKMDILRPLIKKDWSGFSEGEELSELFPELDYPYPTRDTWQAHFTPKIEDAIRKKLGMMQDK